MVSFLLVRCIYTFPSVHRSEDSWGIPTPLSPHVNQGSSCGSSLSSDGETLYFNQNSSADGTSGEILKVTRSSADSPWGDPSLMEEVFNEGESNLSPHISRDGVELYFTSSRAGGLGQWDLWVSRRQTEEDDWGPATHLGTPINSSAGDLGAELSPDGRWLFFTSDRSGGWDLWVSHRRTRTAPWEAATKLPSSVNMGGDVWPSMSSDGSMLYYAVTFVGPEGIDLWQVPVDPLPPMGDYDDDGVLSPPDIDELNRHVRLATEDLRYDVNEDWLLNMDDRDFWVHQLAETYFGDVDLNGKFTSDDMVQRFMSGHQTRISTV